MYARCTQLHYALTQLTQNLHQRCLLLSLSGCLQAQTIVDEISILLTALQQIGARFCEYPFPICYRTVEMIGMHEENKTSEKTYCNRIIQRAGQLNDVLFGFRIAHYVMREIIALHAECAHLALYSSDMGRKGKINSTDEYSGIAAADLIIDRQLSKIYLTQQLKLR